jgi:general secretion pathway protein G
VDFRHSPHHDVSVTGERRPWTPLRWIAAFAAILLAWLFYLSVHLSADFNQARVARARLDVAVIASDGIQAFRVARGRYPTNEEGIEAVIREGFLRPSPIDGSPRSRDPWGRAYSYALPGQVHPSSFDVCTYGADGRPGGARESADICNE